MSERMFLELALTGTLALASMLMASLLFWIHRLSGEVREQSVETRTLSRELETIRTTLAGITKILMEGHHG
ncbi:hypothetical protein GS501_02510 [Saccharibacter sp. 17.LH.SD]|uniref:hypothetical protein n=1 Tax=Saccharibacter sp. 17.LH.SD TaxID=2689393 RepID=UPI00136C288B|nr:hypothetical protein [Saccharibacter sp. 17.LH.SD]MXV43925.1 hypothetical protein [Saccharibacter sp. 17.LH.SD]